MSKIFFKKEVLLLSRQRYVPVTHARDTTYIIWYTNGYYMRRKQPIKL